MKLRCNLGLIRLEECAHYKTDILWLRWINGICYLVCKKHRRDNGRHQQAESNSAADLPKV